MMILDGGSRMSNTMTVSFPGGKKVNANYGAYEIATDQAVDSGGDGSAPEPFDYFLGALATCAGIYVLGFCQQRNIPHDGVSLTQSWEREEKTQRLTNVHISIEVPADFPDKYRDALVRVVNQCLVKKTLENPPEAISYQLSAISYQLSAISYQLSAISYQLSKRIVPALCFVKGQLRGQNHYSCDGMEGDG
jgi:ribosomal protein S12 methylthiotransferase accessory factor